MIHKTYSLKSQREQLTQLVEQWNENRLDLFSLSYPDEDLEIHGVMRFYFQESINKVSTKCMRVSSTATTRAVIEALVEKFHPDMKMLSNPEYGIWEVHETGGERQLKFDEKPLLVQLKWHKDDREGRFLLRELAFELKLLQSLRAHEIDESYTRKTKQFSKKEKKELKKKHQTALLLEPARDVWDLYKIAPPTTFTRTISNPEIVMKKRRERKIESKLKEMVQGGSLKIYGYDLVPSRPYVTILVSIHDRVFKIVKEALEKYGMEDEDCSNYVLVEMLIPTTRKLTSSLSDLRGLDEVRQERYLNDNEFLLSCLASHEESAIVEVIFALRKRPPNFVLPAPRHVPLVENNSFGIGHATRPFSQFNIKLHENPVLNANSPCILQLTPDGRNIASASYIPIGQFVTEIGSDHSMNINLIGEWMHPRHAIINFSDGLVTITPSVCNAEIEVNDVRILHTTVIHPNNIIRIGRAYVFQFFDSENAALNFVNRYYEESAGRSFSSNMQVNRQIPIIDKQTDEELPKKPLRHIPALLDVPIQTEDQCIQQFINNELHKAEFQLAPAFIVYMIGRHRVTNKLSTEAIDNRFAYELQNLFLKIAERCRAVVQDYNLTKELRTFWLANCSELLNFLRQDIDMNALTLGAPQELLLKCIEHCFKMLNIIFKEEVRKAIDSLISSVLDDHEASSSIIFVMEKIMRLLRRCQLNAALTVQLFSQLFHFVSANAFNWLVSPAGAPFCSAAFGVRLRIRLGILHDWAEKQGLELAAECHMDRIQQAVVLLITPKNMNNIANLGATCYKLNSIQVRYLLEHILHDVNEEPISESLVSHVARIAETQADEMSSQDGTAVQLEEESELKLLFVLPQDGYFSEVVRGVPPSLADFLHSLQKRGLCGFILNSLAGNWNANFIANDDIASLKASYKSDDRFKIITLSLNRGYGGIGLSIVAAQGIGERSTGIYIKKVIYGGVAHRNGTLEPGDQLLSVNGQSLVGMSQEEAAVKMGMAGPIVTFEVKKQAAFGNGISQCLMNLEMRRSPFQLENSQFLPSTENLYSNRRNQQQQFHNLYVAKREQRPISSPSVYRQPSPNTTNHFYNQSECTSAAPFNDAADYVTGDCCACVGAYPTSQKHRSASAVELSQDLISVTSTSSFPQQNGSSSIHSAECSLKYMYNNRQCEPNIAIESLLMNPLPLVSSKDIWHHSPITRLIPSERDRELPDRQKAAVPCGDPRHKPYRQLLYSKPSNRIMMDHGAFKTLSNRDELNEESTVRSISCDSVRRMQHPFNAFGQAHQRSTNSSNSSIEAPPPTHYLQRPQQLFLANRTSNLGTNMSASVLSCNEAPTGERVTKLIDEVKHRMGEIDLESLQERCAKMDTKVVSESLKKRKGVQWNNEMRTVLDQQEGKYGVDGDRPSAQILGTQEIYRDPRQQRLIAMQAKQNAAVSVPDGANLGFRDKMKLFAEQIGEKAPKSRLKCSSAEREIESFKKELI